ncbi:unnamed protein product, partial [Rotaria sp. Silwood2]
ILRDQNQLDYNDTSLTFIRNITYIIENKYPSTNMILEIKAPSCRLAGQLLCSHLLKMLFAFYNVNPVLSNQETNMNPTISRPMGLLRHFPTDLVNSALNELANYELIRQGPFITTIRRATIFIRSYPSDTVLNDSLKRNTIDQILNDINIDLTAYMQLLANSTIKDKQILTNTAKQILMLPEHKFLYEKLKEKYPERQLEVNQLPLQSQNIFQIDQDRHISTSDKADGISIILEPSEENTIIEQIDTFATVVNTLYHKQELTSIQLSTHLFNTNTSSIPNETSSSTQQIHMTDKSNENSLNFDENLNDNNQISIGMFFPKTLYSQRAIFFIDNDRNNINPIYSREIHNLTSNVEVRNITSPITNILLPTSLMVGIVDQIISNNSNENTCITSTQPQISRTTGMNTFFKYF